MSQGEEHTDTTLSESSGGRGMHPNSRANLRPPWRPGDSPNPSGLTREGKSPKQAKLEEHIRKRLSKGRTMYKLANALVEKALEGSYPHMNAILERMYPVPQDEAGKRVVLEGLKLELTPGGGASVSMIRGEGTHGAQSFADSDARDSDGGTASPGLPRDTPLEAPLLAPSPPLLEASDTPTTRSVLDP